MTSSPDLPAVADAPRKSRKNNPEKTRENILQEAIVEFVQQGLAGARVDAIAERIHTSKRMIYYYFGSKDGLYLAVLEEAYRRMRSIEADLHLDDLEPAVALRRLVEFTWEHHRDNEDFIRLVMSENIHRAEYLRQSQSMRELNVRAIDSIRELYDRGVAQGVFRSGLDPLDIHAAISALTVFNVANRYTFGAIFDRDDRQAKAQILRLEHVVELILRFVGYAEPE